MDLSVNILSGLQLRDPFMIASSHWTSDEKAFRQLASVRPSAITLKTTSDLMGGDGRGRRDKHRLNDSFGNPFATYTDGPRTVELWDVATTYEMTRIAQRSLTDCVLGLSILQEEDYESVSKQLNLASYGYIELNCKYTFRKRSLQSLLTEELEHIHRDIKKFLDIFLNNLPVLVKLPREIAPLLDTPEFQRILATINEAKAGLIVANSRRIRVPPSRTTGTKELATGVVVGEYLFLETYHMVQTLDTARQEGAPTHPIVASGGISDIGGFVDLITAGAKAVQLCTILDISGVQVVPWLREQLEILCRDFGSFARFSDEIRSDQSRSSDVIQLARDFRLNPLRSVKEVFRKQEVALLQLLVGVIRDECGAVGMITTEQDCGEIPKGLRFVVTQGNASSFLLSKRCIYKAGFLPIELESSGDFVNSLKDPNFMYDFAIVPESTFRNITRQRSLIPENNRPVEIGHIADSIFELVCHTPKDLLKINFVYHFGGTTSRYALGELLKVHKMETEEISDLIRPKLLPLLRFWQEGSAILAKPPLSRIYGMLGRGDMQRNWGPIWKTTEKLVLVLPKWRKDIPEGERERLGRAVLRWIELERRQVLQSLEGAALELRSLGFLEHCANLLIPVQSQV